MTADRGERLVDARRVLRHQRHADHGLEIRSLDAAQAPERLEPLVEAARQAAHFSWSAFGPSMLMVTIRRPTPRASVARPA
jgi:hypothetical protein